MANSITTFDKIVNNLDEVYRLGSKTSVLDNTSGLVQDGANAHEIKYPKLSMDGLGTYNRTTSTYAAGDVSLSLETVVFNYERGRLFTIDVMDDEETAGALLGNLAGEFMRTKIVPELDAFRFAQYCAIDGISELAAETFTTGKDVLEALNTAFAEMTDNEVPEEQRQLFITPTLFQLANSVDTTVDKAILQQFAGVNIVPQNRFYTGITLLDGTTTGQEAGGYERAANTGEINFMIIHQPATLQYEKRSIGQPIGPEYNNTGDATIYKFREYGLCDAYENKAAGIYLSAQADES